MRILLIAPRSEFPDVTPGWLRFSQMSLLILEALSGPDHEVTTIEEEIESIPYDQSWDVVGITVMTATAHHAYQIAHRFRQLGTKVVLGGVHPSLLPEEGTQHADAVVVGEAEGIWPQVLEDAGRDRLQPIYFNTTPDINKMPLVRYQNRRRRFPPAFHPLVASRGCPKNCEFCCVHKVYGQRFRRLAVDRVLQQIQLRHTRDVMFLDDNISSHRGWAMELFTRLIPFNLRIISQVPVSFILDEKLFTTALAAGLTGVFVGIESIDENAMARYSKSVTLEAYAEAIRRCRHARVIFHAALIFGMDEHDKSIFDYTYEFVMRHSIPSVSAYVLTPYPGTDLYDRLEHERRLLHRNWAYYDHLTPVFQPSRMSLQDLVSGYMRFRQRLFSMKGILQRFPVQIPIKPLTYLCMSIAFHNTTNLLKEHYHRYFHWLDDSAHRSLAT
jgi:radical SAM superfamily enzyme YgiQ (UPF0313 family)